MKFLLSVLLLALFALPPLVSQGADGPSAEKPAPRQPILQQFGIESSNASADIFNKVADAAALEKGGGIFIKDAVDKSRAEAVKMGKSPNSIAGMAGNWLELALIIALKHKGLTPIYYQFQLQKVTDSVMDVAVFSEKRGPIVMSCKTSLRERYKQSEEEAVETRKHFPNQMTVIVTLDADKKHVANVRKKIEKGEVEAVEGVYDETNLDKFFEMLAQEKLVEPTDKVLKRARLVVK